MGTALESAWAKTPLVTRIVVTGVLLSVIGLTTPMWAYIKDSGTGSNDLSFGLFHYCSGPVCSSIHDNVVPGRDIPFWFHMTQVFFFIGCACCAISMFIIASSKKGKKLRMTNAMTQMVVLLLLAGATQMFTALYTFVMYFENTNFLYEEVAEVDFYGSFYCGVAGAIANFFGGMILFFDDDVTTPVPIKKLQPDNLLFRDFRFKKPEIVPLSEDSIEPHLTKSSSSRRPFRNLMEELYFNQVTKQSLLDKAMKKKNSKKNK